MEYWLVCDRCWRRWRTPCRRWSDAVCRALLNAIWYIPIELKDGILRETICTHTRVSQVYLSVPLERVRSMSAEIEAADDILSGAATVYSVKVHHMNTTYHTRVHTREGLVVFVDGAAWLTRRDGRVLYERR